MAATATLPTWMQTEPEDTSRPLAGTQKNGARDPKRKPNAGEKGSMGDMALMDGLIIVGAAWIILFFLAYSLRHHNV